MMRRTLAFAMGAALLGGCTVGPDFHAPAAPQTPGYTATPLADTADTANLPGGAAQHFTEGADIAGDWWSLFRSRPLNDLIDRALKANPDIDAAQAALDVARENALAQGGAYYPRVNGSVSATRGQTSKAVDTGETLSLFTPQVSVSFVPDVFGLNQRLVESLEAQRDAARFQLAAAHITLSSNVVAAAVQESALRAQIQATREIIAVNSDMLQVLRNEYAKGHVSRVNVASQESQLAQITATLPGLLKQLDQQRDLLAALAGGLPAEGVAEQFQLDELQLPVELPVSLPSQLVRQRPDVRQAEASLHAASARIGVAVANRLPNITLTADVGRMARTPNGVLNGGAGFWDIGANLTAPLFDAGSLEHQEQAASAAYREAEAQYRKTVITAFQNVADTLYALQHDAEALRATSAAVDAARVTLDLARRQLETGRGTALDLLNAEQTYQQASINLIQARANRYADTAALFQALGGGWWNRADLSR